MEFDLEESRLMEVEWQAWQDVCGELRKLGIEINDQDMLNGYLVRWGKMLVKLRTWQRDHGKDFTNEG